MASESLRQLGSFIAQNLSNTVLGCAKLGFKHEELLARVAQAAQATLSEAAVQVGLLLLVPEGALWSSLTCCMVLILRGRRWCPCCQRASGVCMS
jgi:hypothetical protein